MTGPVAKLNLGEFRNLLEKSIGKGPVTIKEIRLPEKSGGKIYKGVELEEMLKKESKNG